MEHNFPFLGPPLRATLLPARVGHKSLMKIKQRKNYIHLAVTIVPVFSTPETFQGRFCLRQPFLSSTASARASSGLSGPPCSSSGLFVLSTVPLPSPPPLAQSTLLVRPSLIYCIFAKMELIEVVFAAARYYNIASDVTGKSNGVCTTSMGV